MKKLTLCAAAAALSAALIVVGGAVGRSTASTVAIATSLTTAAETPAPTGDVSNARGAFAATLTRSGAGAVMTWRLTFSGLSGNAVAAHIHTGAAGVAGPVSVPLCGPCDSPATGSANVDAAVLAALATNRAYVNVHTPTNRGGEIRGQLRTVAVASATMTARQEVPRPRGAARARGAFVVTATKAGATTTLRWRLTFSRLTGPAIAAHIHLGARGKAGRVAVPLCGPCRSGRTGTAVVSGVVLAALESGRAYVNVHTRRNPPGEIRGQIPALALTLS